MIVDMESYYANLVAYRMTPNEFVLEFGNFFQGQGDRLKPEFQDFDVRVVMTPGMIDLFINMLQEAKKQRDLQLKALAQNTVTEKQ